jgi:citrate lyase subunit beta/citryl-CoA lyase
MLWGGEDLSVGLGATVNRDASGAYTSPFRLARDLCLMAARAAGVIPIDAVFTDFRNPDGLAREAAAARRDGFAAKAAIHPSQVPVINAAFTPREEEIARAQAIVNAFSANPGAGALQLDGQMIDQPHLEQARRLLDRLS